MAIESAIRRALETCPLHESWQVAFVEHHSASFWEALVQGPRLQTSDGWQVAEPPPGADGELIYTRQFRRDDERHPLYVELAFRQLFRCEERAATP